MISKVRINISIPEVSSNSAISFSCRTNLRSVFGDESSAEKFAEHFRELGHEVSVKNAGTWDVIVVRHMVPSHEGITNFENLLQSVAERWGGQNDAGAVLTKAEAGPKKLCYLRVHLKKSVHLRSSRALCFLNS